MGRVLVTGATGFIGRRLVERLAGRGAEVRCLVRDPSAPAPPGVERVRGDVTDRASLDAAVEGVDAVYHLAGQTLSLSASESHRVNAGGTRNLAAACASKASPPTLVFVSSLAAAGPSIGERPLVEEDAARPVSDYGRSKHAAEQALRPFANSLPISVFRPPGVFGPGDRNLLTLFRAIHRGWNVVPVRTPLRMSLVYVDDLAAALEQGEARGTRLELDEKSSRGLYYVAFDESPPYADLGRLIARALGRSFPTTVRVPSTVGFVVAGLAGAIGQIRRRPALVNLDKMREAAAGSWTCDPSRARRELGFQPPKTLADRLKETADWYRDEKWIKN